MSAAAWTREWPYAPHHLTTPAGRIHYVDEGHGGAPMLCVHGNPTWSFYWRRLIQSFSGSRRVVALDHVGCGLSDKPQDWSYRLADHVENVVRLVEHLDLRDITLVVHDWGGAIGLGMATRLPDRIGRIVVLNTAAFPFDRIPARIAVCRVPGLGALLVRGLNGFARAAVFMATEKGLSPDAAAGLVAPYHSWNDRIATLRFVEDIPMDSGHASWPELQRIADGLSLLKTRPMLIIWGEEDWCFTPAFREEWQRRFPDAEVHPLNGVGHYVMEDAADEVIRLLHPFLASEAPR